MVTLLKGYDNFCSTAFLTGQGQFRMMYSHNVLYYGQSKASSSRLLGTALVYAVEPLKHPALMLFGYANSGIFYPEKCVAFFTPVSTVTLPPRLL